MKKAVGPKKDAVIKELKKDMIMRALKQNVTVLAKRFGIDIEIVEAIYCFGILAGAALFQPKKGAKNAKARAK